MIGGVGKGRKGRGNVMVHLRSAAAWVDWQQQQQLTKREGVQCQLLQAGSCLRVRAYMNKPPDAYPTPAPHLLCPLSHFRCSQLSLQEQDLIPLCNVSLYLPLCRCDQAV